MLRRDLVSKMSKSKICVVDLESSCWVNQRVKLPNGAFTTPVREIIEIGAVISDIKTGNIFDSFDHFVRPVVNPLLSDFCKCLTTITQENVNEAALFPVVISNFSRWLEKFGGPEDILFSSWGYYDKSQLLADCHMNECPYPFSDDHLNIKEMFSEVMGFKKGKGLSKALRILKMEFEGTHHRGGDDARNIHRIWLKIKDMPSKIVNKCNI